MELPRPRILLQCSARSRGQTSSREELVTFMVENPCLCPFQDFLL